MKHIEPDFTNDEYWGKGGSYVVDPETGKRKPAPAPGAVAATIAQRPDDAAPGGKVNAQDVAQAGETEEQHTAASPRTSKKP